MRHSIFITHDAGLIEGPNHLFPGVPLTARINLLPAHVTVVKNTAKLIRITASRLPAGSSVAIPPLGFRSVLTSRETVAAGAFLAFRITTAYWPRSATMRRNSPEAASEDSASVSCSRPRLNCRNSLMVINSTCTLAFPFSTSKRQSTSVGICRIVRGSKRQSPGSNWNACLLCGTASISNTNAQLFKQVLIVNGAYCIIAC